MRAQLENWVQCERELAALFPLHWQEATQRGEMLPLEMNWPLYRKACHAGALQLATLRAGRELVGYWSVMVGPHLHSKSRRVAHTDLVFIRRERRKGRGLLLLHSVLEQRLRALGVTAWFVAEKEHLANARPLYTRLGFNPEERIYVKFLGVQDG